MKFKQSIAQKLFLITAFIMVIFILIALLVQSVFFKGFYMMRKKGQIESGLNKIEQSYAKANSNDEAVNIINNFEGSSQYKVIILDSNGNLKYISSTNFEREDIFKLGYIRALVISLNENNLLSNIKNKNGTVTYTTDERFVKTRSLVCAKYIKEKNEFLILIGSLQPVNEAMIVTRQFYMYILAGGVLIIILLSFIFSSIVSKSLIKINKTATKMANLDFSEKCEVKSEDEVGNLAASLNILSENLQNALGSLKQANVKLTEDIEKERNLEKMRKEFIAAVSHELKTPISLIEGYTEGIKDGVFDKDETGNYLDLIIDESYKMANLVEDMLDLSQLESGNFKLVRDEFYLDELIKTTLRKYNVLMNEKNINIKCYLLNNISVTADWDRIEQVINNYLSNAIKHTEDGGDIVINMLDEDDSIKVEVINKGSKIPDGEMENIWEKFYKIDKSRNRKLGGTGIGLSIVKNIMILHEGNYGVENTDDGVKFYFSLKKTGHFYK